MLVAVVGAEVPRVGRIRRVLRTGPIVVGLEIGERTSVVQGAVRVGAPCIRTAHCTQSRTVAQIAQLGIVKVHHLAAGGVDVVAAVGAEVTARGAGVGDGGQAPQFRHSRFGLDPHCVVRRLGSSYYQGHHVLLLYLILKLDTFHQD